MDKQKISNILSSVSTKTAMVGALCLTISILTKIINNMVTDPDNIEVDQLQALLDITKGYKNKKSIGDK